jgi:hypothetical protein
MYNSEKAGQAQAAALRQRLKAFQALVLMRLNERLDKRLVRTFRAAVEAIPEFRHNGQGWLLSELGGCILSPAQALAGTKALSNLLRSAHWHYGQIEQFLWRCSDEQVTALQGAGEETFASDKRSTNKSYCGSVRNARATACCMCGIAALPVVPDTGRR